MCQRAWDSLILDMYWWLKAERFVNDIVSSLLVRVMRAFLSVSSYFFVVPLCNWEMSVSLTECFWWVIKHTSNQLTRIKFNRA